LRKIFSNRKGVSGAISGMFVVAIFALIITAFFAYTSALNNYIQVVNERNRLDWEQLNERIIVSNISIDDSGVLKANVSNVGAVTAHLVQMWITKFNENGGSEWQIQYLIDFYLSPGETLYNFGSYGKFIRIPEKQTFSSISSLDKQSRYKIKLVTERGNVAIGEYTPAKGFEEGINWTKMNVEILDGYVYYKGAGQAQQWYCRVKNTGSITITITMGSLIIFDPKNPPSQPEDVYYIGYLSMSVDKISLKKDEVTTLYFNFISQQNPPFEDKLIAKITLIGVDENGNYCINMLNATTKSGIG
jgi:hypothetical protein